MPPKLGYVWNLTPRRKGLAGRRNYPPARRNPCQLVAYIDKKGRSHVFLQIKMNGINIKYSIPDRIIKLPLKKTRKLTTKEISKLFKQGKLKYINWQWARENIIKDGNRQKKNSASSQQNP